MPSGPARGRLKCWRCGTVLETTAGRSLDAALACAIATFLLLLRANLMPAMTLHLAGITRSTYLASGIATSWQQGWPLVATCLGLQAIALPLVRFGLLSATLAAIRFSGINNRWVGAAFRYSEALDAWAMVDVLLIGGGIGYGRVATQVPVQIEAGGWCLVGAALMTMLTRATLERRAVWRRLAILPCDKAGPIACLSCDAVLPSEAEGRSCPRCLARVYRRRPYSVLQCRALVLTTFILTPIAYWYPMSEIWEAGKAHPHTIIDGIRILAKSSFWYFAILLSFVSVVFPLVKLFSLTWCLVSVGQRSTRWLRRKTQLYRFVDEVGRWSTLDPFTVMIFTPLIQFGQEVHVQVMGGSAAFLATVILSMTAARAFDPRLMWDALGPGVAGADAPAHLPRDT